MSLRVFELAKELNIPTKKLIKRIDTMGLKITGNFSALSDEQITSIKKNLLEPTTRIMETVVSGAAGTQRVRRRIISAKKAEESQKIKKSLKVEDIPSEADLEARDQSAASKAKSKEKIEKGPKKKIRKKSSEAKAEKQIEVSEEKIESTDLEEAETPEVKIEPAKVEAESADVEPEVVKTEPEIAKAEPEVVIAKPESVEVEPMEKRKERRRTRPSFKNLVKRAQEIETKKKEQVSKKEEEDKIQAKQEAAAREQKREEQREEQKKAKADSVKTGKKTTQISEKKDDKPQKVKSSKDGAEAEKGSKQDKGVKTKETIAAEELAKKTQKFPPKKKKFKANFNEDSNRPGDNFSKANRFNKKKKLSKSARRKERENRQKEANKQKHTFRPRQKDLVVGEFVSVGDLAKLIGIKVPEIIKTLMSLGIMATITQSIDGDTAVLVASEHDIELKVEFSSIEDSLQQSEDNEENLLPRSPVVTIMGHVDHGKTSLLDKIRSTNVIDGEAGGITQHIGAYHVKAKEGNITFLDTPGHEAFTAMRARGADVTDIVVLIVAADDGPRPQTIEAIDHAKAAKVEIIVAVNKCDKPDANPDKTIQQLMEYGLVSEEFGGDIPMIKISAKSGEGIPKLLEIIHLQAEIMEMKANPNRMAEGVVIESRIDKGKGNTATILIQSGTLKIGDNYIVGTEYGRVRAMWNDRSKKITEATPSIPVEIVGLNGVPKAGDRFNVGQDEKQVRQIATLRYEKEKEKKQSLQQKRTLEHLFDSMGKAEKRILNLIIKADVIGSLEALSDALNKLGNEQVAINIIRGSVGAITSNDVLLAATSDAVVIGFNTRPDAPAKKIANEESIDIRLYSVIYETIDDIKNALEGMLEPIIREEIQGKAEILEIFNIPKVGVIAGSKVTEGKFTRDCPVRVIRDHVIIHVGKLSSLRRFKDLVKEVSTGYECGIGVDVYKDLRVGDELEAFTRLETAAKL